MSYATSTNSVAFNNAKNIDSLTYDLSTGAHYADSDTQALVPDSREKSDILQVVKAVISDILKNHFKLFVIVCDIFCVILFTLCMLAFDAIACESFKRQDILEWCQPFETVDHVIVDLNFDLLVHCDRPRSCVAYAEILTEKQGYNYNFIIGDEDLVYVGKGYQCKSDALRLQMLITRYTWDPKQPVYRIPEEVIIRYSEVLYEGVRCGKVTPNFTMRVTCSVYGEYCGADNIRDHVPWTIPGALAHIQEGRHPWQEPEHSSHAFMAFDIDRVYDRQYKLQTCNFTQPL